MVWKNPVDHYWSFSDFILADRTVSSLLSFPGRPFSAKFKEVLSVSKSDVTRAEKRILRISNISWNKTGLCVYQAVQAREHFEWLYDRSEAWSLSKRIPCNHRQLEDIPLKNPFPMKENDERAIRKDMSKRRKLHSPANKCETDS